MSMDARVSKLEEALGPEEDIVIRVVRAPDDVEDLKAYIAAHPDAVSKTVVVRGRTGSLP